MEPKGEEEAMDGALDEYLTRVRGVLCAKDAFADENERIKWIWRLHQLRQRRQLVPELWAGAPTRLLAEIEAQIACLSTEEDPEELGSDAEGQRREARVDVGFDMSDGEKRGSNEDRGSIPMMENRQGGGDEETSNTSSWTSITRMLRRASAVLMGTTPQSDRDSFPVINGSVAVDIHEEEKQEYTAYDPGYEHDQDGEAFAAATTASSAGHWKLETDSPRQREDDSPANRGSRGGSDGSSQGLRQSVPNLLRSFVSYLGLSMEETFLCQICYDYTPVSSSATLSNCQHAFCQSCLQNFLEFKISEAQVYPTCFFQPKDEKEGACSAAIAVEDIRAIVSNEAWQKYNKFKFNKENELARQCPFCDHSQLCAGLDDPACTCTACGRDFCFLHSNAHEGRTCAEYDKKMLAIEKLNHALISEISKPCPGCQNHVEKTGGCNQMKCVVCNTSFCWICLAVIDDNVFPEHFQWWNIRGCAGNQMADVEQQSRTEKVAQTILRLGFFVVFGPPALVLAIVACILCCFFKPCTANGRMTFRHAFTSCFCISGYALLAPFVLAAGLALLGIVLSGAAAAAAVVLALSPLLCLLVLVKFDSFRAWRSR